MTLGVDYNYGLLVSPETAITGENAHVSFSIGSSDGSAIPAGSSVRCITISSGSVDIPHSNSLLCPLDENGHYSSTSSPIQTDGSGGSIRVMFTELFLGDEGGEGRSISGASGTIRILPDPQFSSPPGPSEETTVTAATGSVYDGQNVLFYITSSSYFEGGVGFSAPGITEIGKGCNGGTVGAQWLGLPQTSYCTDRSEISLSFPSDGGVASRGYRTGVNANITSNGSVSVSGFGAEGSDSASITVIARKGVTISDGSVQSLPDDLDGATDLMKPNPQPTDDDGNPVPQTPITTGPPSGGSTTVTATGDNSNLDTLSVGDDIIFDDMSSGDIPESADIVLGDGSEYIGNNDEGADTKLEPSVSGSGGKTKRGRGSSRANNDNDYEGDTVIEEGCLIIGQGGLGQSKSVVIRDGACLIIDNSEGRVTIDEDVTITIEGNATIQSDSGVAFLLGTIIAHNTTDILNITTSDHGGITFTQQHPMFDGNTIIAANAVLDYQTDDNDITIHQGNIDVYGTLKGRGRIAGNVTIKSNGYLLVGDEVSTESHITGNLILEDDSHTYISFESNTTDQLRVDGNITIGSNVELLLIPFELNIKDTPFTFVNYNGTLTGQFMTVTDFKDNFTDNGIDNLPDDQYPSVLDYSVNGVITGSKP